MRCTAALWRSAGADVARPQALGRGAAECARDALTLRHRASRLDVPLGDRLCVVRREVLTSVVGLEQMTNRMTSFEPEGEQSDERQ